MEGEMMNDLTGQKFGRLLVLYDSGERKGRKVVWVCLCACGNFTEVKSDSLGSGRTKSCGCFMIDQTKKANIGNKYSIKHGDALSSKKSRLYTIWSHMKERCSNPNDKKYRRYGGRGIKVCDDWRDNYSAFKSWAISNGYRDDLTIDRIDNDGNYEPSNCQFITRSENSRKGCLVRWANA